MYKDRDVARNDNDFGARLIGFLLITARRRVTIVTKESNTFRNKREAKELYLKRGNGSVAVNIEQKFLCKTFNYTEINKDKIYCISNVHIHR